MAGVDDVAGVGEDVDDDADEADCVAQAELNATVMASIGPPALIISALINKRRSPFLIGSPEIIANPRVKTEGLVLRGKQNGVASLSKCDPSSESFHLVRHLCV